jgi:hypothetical protein
MIGTMLFLARDARADSETDWFTISELRTTSSDAFVLLLNPGVSNNSKNDPANCQSSGNIVKFEVLTGSSVTQFEKDLMFRTALAAFLAGKEVKVNLSSSTCVNGNPAFAWISTR